MAAQEEPRDPSLDSLLELHREVMLEAVNVMLPGQIVSYDATKQIASVQPLIKTRHYEEDGETLVVESRPVIHKCPVVFCGTSRGRLTWPVAVGDTCEIRFASSSIARWVVSGGQVDPGDDRTHDLSDAVVFVGLHDAAHVPTTAPTDAVVLHAGTGVTVKIGGPTGTQPTLMATSFLSALNDLVNVIATQVGNCSTGTNTAAATAITAALTAFNLAATGYKTTKAEVL